MNSYMQVHAESLKGRMGRLPPAAECRPLLGGIAAVGYVVKPLHCGCSPLWQVRTQHGVTYQGSREMAFNRFVWLCQNTNVTDHGVQP